MNTVIKRMKTKQELNEEFVEIQAAQKTPEKFEVLYNRYYEQILLYVYQRMDSKEIAYDVTQQVFMKALANIKKYKNKGVPFSAWLYKIAANELTNYFKKNQKQRSINIESVQLEVITDELGEESIDDLYNKVVQAISSLPGPDLNLIEMRFMENRPFKEIADILSITETNAKVKVYRLIDKLKKQLAHLNPNL